MFWKFTPPLASKQQTVEAIVTAHWEEFGRHYYSRHDYEGLTAEQGARVMQQVSWGICRSVIGWCVSRD